ncbi:type I-E CRISPR-associated protein Cse2/CasB [Phycicoccus sp. CSK15P-2]|uniref:type I-E CRISPR-associated protein Cse2/CasB n=1 Tax=Phycicoccus sp. CSK15P-2 TaxID=2807627 RepID=UPI00194E7370|nr:type I-E CRISPR-associated protein Cse2/CasB [Phycicoccus sp. CSK15P-2]MBM6404834.1 type I-E CRISPR-associated protein Cse2/CasB [Phycicoccus sp. CSK15P-2]
MSTQENERPPFYWERMSKAGDEMHVAQQMGPDLAAFRRGLGREPGEVPGMWRFYTKLTADGRVTDALRAEHAALALFGLHQQGGGAPVHVNGRPMGAALHDLRSSPKYSEQAVDAHFARAATADEPGEVIYHLRGLVQQLKAANITGFDYTTLYFDLLAWHRTAEVGRIRRRWAGQYFQRPAATTGKDPA